LNCSGNAQGGGSFGIRQGTYVLETPLLLKALSSLKIDQIYLFFSDTRMVPSGYHKEKKIHMGHSEK